MKVRPYRVSLPNGGDLVAILKHLQGTPLEDRIRETATTRLRLDDETEGRSGVWHLDFLKFRSAGPGKASDKAKTKDFDLADDEYFGEETAALFDPKTSYLILQYNHFGPRAAAIESYLSLAETSLTGNTSELELQPVLRQDAVQRLNKAKLVRKFEFKLYLPGVMNKPTGKRQSLNQILANKLVSSAESISIEISAARSKSLSISEVKAYVAEMLGIKEDVSQLSVRAQQDEEAPSEPIDLLEAQLVTNVPLTLTGGKGRYGRSERWAALSEAYALWRDNRQL